MPLFPLRFCAVVLHSDFRAVVLASAPCPTDNGPSLSLSDGKEFPGVWGATELWPRPMERQPGERSKRGSDGLSLARLWVWSEAVCRQEDRREWDAAFADACEWQQTVRESQTNMWTRKRGKLNLKNKEIKVKGNTDNFKVHQITTLLLFLSLWYNVGLLLFEVFVSLKSFFIVCLVSDCWHYKSLLSTRISKKWQKWLIFPFISDFSFQNSDFFLGILTVIYKKKKEF